MPESSIVPALMAVIADRKACPPAERSYVVSLVQGGAPRIGAKIIEEAGEVVAAADETGDLGRAHRMIRRLKAGIVWVNTYRAVSPIVPFGGYGQSGLGREGGLESILDYSRTKSVWIRTSDDPIPDPFVMR